MESYTTMRLHHFAYTGNIAEVQRLIERKVHLDSRDAYGNTAIHHAIKGNQVKIFLLLLNSGADVKAVNDDGFNALHLAIKNGNEMCVTALLGRNIPVNQVNKKGLTELMVAMTIDKSVEEVHRNKIIEQLLEFEKINIRELSYNQQKQTALHFAAKFGCVFALNRMLEKDSTLYNIGDAFGNLALHTAAVYGNPEIIKELLRIFPNLDLNVKGGNLRTPLQMAIMGQAFSTIELLIELNVDCNVADQDGNTALHIAVNVFNSCCDSEYPSEVTCESEDDHGFEIKKIRQSLSATIQIECYNLAVIKFLIEKGNADINAVNNAAITPLDLLAHDKVILKMINAAYQQKLERNEFQVTNNSEAVKSEALENEEEEQLHKFISDELNTTEDNATQPTRPEVGGKKVMMLEERIASQDYIIKQLSKDLKTVKLQLEAKHEEESDESEHEEYNVCWICSESATYSLLCGHVLCSDCYENNSGTCMTCNVITPLNFSVAKRG